MVVLLWPASMRSMISVGRGGSVDGFGADGSAREVGKGAKAFRLAELIRDAAVKANSSKMIWSALDWSEVVAFEGSAMSKPVEEGSQYRGAFESKNSCSKSARSKSQFTI